jgi:hypothetical protein
MAVTRELGVERFIGLSSDSKPTSVLIGSTFTEYDTGNIYKTYDGTNWAFFFAQAGLEHSIEKTDGSVPLGDDNLFVVSGGPILVTHFSGLVKTLIGANVATCTIQHANTDPAADIALSTAVAITDDAVGTAYYITSAALGVFTPVTASSAIQATTMLPWLLAPGILQATFSAANTGAIRWFLTYKPLSPLSVVTAAA